MTDHAETAHAEHDNLDLSEAEVSQLWWFSDGAIMNPQTRQRLRRSWGLCDRHAWASFVIECELRWQPLGTAVLYEDLLDRAIATWPARWATSRARRRVFAGHPCCATCDYHDHRAVRGFGEHQRQANQRARSRAFVAGCQANWQQWMCPWCVPSGPGVPCRPHLAAGDSPMDRTGYEALTSLRTPLRACTRSMTHDGPPPTPETNAELVIVLGWFAGWRGALALAPDAWSATPTPTGGDAR